MKKILTTALVIVLTGAITPAIGQDCEIYKDYKEGTSTTMVHYDKKDKPTGNTVTTVKEKKNIVGGVSLLFHQQYSDYEEYSFESEFEIRCVNGDVIVDMGKFIDPATLAAYENMEIDIEADDLSIPRNASPGDELNNGTVTVTVNTGTPIKVTVQATLSNRRVDSREKIETPAGTFDCLKLSYDMLTKIGFLKIQSSASEYYNSEHGVIKSETFNKKGKLTGYSVVEEISN
ncbi:MAG: hypothetical protein WD052_08890 [Bacteroidales bacterium]